MSMIDDMWVNAKSAAETVGKKAGQMLDRSKLRLAVMDVKGELSKKYRLLGKLCYEAHKSGKDYTESQQALLENITELNAQLASLRDMLAGIEKKVKCAACGSYNQKGALFCSKCGARLTVKTPADDDYTQEELLDFAEEIMDEEDI